MLVRHLKSTSQPARLQRYTTGHRCFASDHVPSRTAASTSVAVGAGGSDSRLDGLRLGNEFEVDLVGRGLVESASFSLASSTLPPPDQPRPAGAAQEGHQHEHSGVDEQSSPSVSPAHTSPSVTATVEVPLGPPLTASATSSASSALSAVSPITLYAGVDPTAPALHIGNLVVLATLRRFQLAGHRVIALLGGATGMIGDPSGKSNERELLDEAKVAENAESIRKSVEKLLDIENCPNGSFVANNLDWHGNMSAIELLRDVGKNFRLGTMLRKESVKSRLDGDDGMSYTEFSYQVLQAYDYYHLANEHNCVLQIGGSDQWGNITAGIEFCKKKLGRSVHGLTLPLLTRAGKKMGKSEGGAVWLDPEMMSPFSFYQYFIGVADEDVVQLLLTLSFLPLEHIRDILHEHDKDRGKRLAQNALAESVTEYVHGPESVATAKRTSAALFGASSSEPYEALGLSAAELISAFDGVPTLQLSDSSGTTGTSGATAATVAAASAGTPRAPPTATAVSSTVLDVAVAAGACQSRRAARRLASDGGLYLNNRRVDTSDLDTLISERLIDSTVAVLRVGKKKHFVVRTG